MPSPKEHAQMERLFQATRKRIRLKPWESVLEYTESPNEIRVVIDTHDVQELVREDRYKAHGQRGVFFTRKDDRWVEQLDFTVWDDDFVPYTFEKIGRRKTADEMIDQREWEKLCHRPGTKSTPLDSYERVLDPFIRSTDRMERHF